MLVSGWGPSFNKCFNPERCIHEGLLIFSPICYDTFYSKCFSCGKVFLLSAVGSGSTSPQYTCLCPVRFLALISTAGFLRSPRLQITPSSRTFGWIWALHGFAEIRSKAVCMPQSAAVCRCDSTLHHALAGKLSSGEPRKQENFEI